jgi:phthalate 4,5-cis-dihydrodiol dehydrogenase
MVLAGPGAPMSVLRIGVAGLGRAFTLMLPTFLADSRVRLVAAADPLPAARARFSSDFGAPAYEQVEALCADPSVDLVYIASPHQHHAEHVAVAAAAGKHVLVEKPMALTLAQCDAMIDATRRAGVHLIVGHSHSFNLPILQTRKLIESGRHGAVRMLTALNFTDFLYRPRRPEELDTAAGGGVIHSQAAHQIDILRLLGGGQVRTVYAQTGAWDPQRPTEGAYQALLGFAGGVFASATYSGYGHFDSDSWMGGIGEMGQLRQPDEHGMARRRLAALAEDPQAEARLKADRGYGGSLYVPPASASPASAYQHFGPIIVSCDSADLRPLPDGVEILDHQTRSMQRLPAPAVPRSEVIDEVVATLGGQRPPLHSGTWARATTEVCLAILESARTGAVQPMRHQVATPRAGHGD